MSQAPHLLALILVLLVSSTPARSGERPPAAATAPAERPLIERAAPDPARRARLASWRLELERQRPALAAAIAALERERRWWHGSTGRRRCAQAAAALARVDRAALFAVADYRLVSAAGAALDELAAAVRACHTRRYVELDYRLGLAGGELERLARLLAPPAAVPEPRR